MKDINPKQKVARFPTTDWEPLTKLANSELSDQRPLLDIVAQRYWLPIYYYLLRKYYPPIDAQDLAQEFFAFALQRRLFNKADPHRGRFRSFLLTALNNFLANERRRSAAAVRMPPGGFANIDELAESGYLLPKGLFDARTPEAAFEMAWTCEVVRNVLRDLEQECIRTNKTSHFTLFRTRVVAPELEGDPLPDLAEQARELGLGYKEAANRVTTMKRAFLRLLAREVQTYTGSAEEAAQERQEALRLLVLDTSH